MSKPMIIDIKDKNPVDLHVGSRVRLRRKLLGLSQEALGNALGLTFQQVQKYERGANRISASKLHEMARFLKVPVPYFFEGVGGEEDGFVESDSERSVHDFLATVEGVELAEAFPRIRSASRRRKLLELVKALSE
ncbi:MAG: helix-turn-helix transcriptional regulator [Asticcacaulis sp.]|uniref:helix-turn-helix domain-containing protein n=1 Tax=Asticcacaulis sp. TaxID=1872648 RepID=UPI0039E3B997